MGFQPANCGIGTVLCVVATLLARTQATDFLCTNCRVGNIARAESRERCAENGGIFPGLEFHCEGSVARWHLCAETTGSIYVSVWEKKRRSYQLKGFSKLYVEHAGCKVYDVPIEERCYVTHGDVIGVFYDEDDARAKLSCDLTGQSCQPLVGDSSDLNTGDTVPGDNDRLVPGSPSIQADVRGLCPYLRLVPEEDHRKGRAEIKRGGQWGTICDKWFELYGWPNTFCKQLGFPESVVANYTSHFGSRYEVPSPDIPIHLQSPNECKASLGRTMLECPEHERGQCDHDLDIYVECAPKVRCHQLVNESTHCCHQVSCTPQIWLGCWGNICDDKDPCKHITREGKTWATAFCKELGFKQVQKVELASEAMPDLVQELPVLYHNPVCQVKRPTIIDNCPPGGKKCNTCDLYRITCSDGDDGCGKPTCSRKWGRKREWNIGRDRTGNDYDHDDHDEV